MVRTFPEIPEEVLNVAKDEYHVSTFRHAPYLSPIHYEGKVVGFYCPRQRKIGVSSGPVFVLPEYRKKGLALELFNSTSGPLVACVRDDNLPSIGLVIKAGFVQWRRYAAGWWWRRD